MYPFVSIVANANANAHCEYTLTFSGRDHRDIATVDDTEILPSVTSTPLFVVRDPDSIQNKTAHVKKQEKRSKKGKLGKPNAEKFCLCRIWWDINLSRFCITICLCLFFTQRKGLNVQKLGIK